MLSLTLKKLDNFLNTLQKQRRRWQRVSGAKDLWRKKTPMPSKSRLWSMIDLVKSTPFNASFLLFKVAYQNNYRFVHLFLTPRYHFFQPLRAFYTKPSLFFLNFKPFALSGILSSCFVKFKYKGKSFRWHRRKGGLVLKFGASHLVTLTFPFFIKTKKSGKMKLVFFGSSRYQLRSFLHSAYSWRPINIYNARGLRFAKQRVLRKHGKVSAYR